MEILDLPTDVMIVIFKLLTPSERRITTTVCHDWLNMVNGYFSKDNWLVLTSDLDYTPTESLFRTYSDVSTTFLSFSQLEIKSVPINAEERLLMENFIGLVGDIVTSLKITCDFKPSFKHFQVGSKFIRNLFSKFPKLETLEVSSDVIFTDLSANTVLNGIKSFANSFGYSMMSPGTIALLRSNTSDDRKVSLEFLSQFKQLKEVTITDKFGFSLSQEVDWFSNLPSLMKVQWIPKLGNTKVRRVMERNDAQNIKGYLSKNMSLYWNLKETIEYVVKYVIPRNEYEQMFRSVPLSTEVNDSDDAERLRDLTVTYAFLGMDPERFPWFLHRFMVNRPFVE